VRRRIARRLLGVILLLRRRIARGLLGVVLLLLRWCVRWGLRRVLIPGVPGLHGRLGWPDGLLDDFGLLFRA